MTTVSRTDASESRAASNVLLILGAVGSPIALGTALLLYFGWVRSQAQAAAFGADVSVFEMSPQDLVLRSVDVLFFPIILLLLGGLLLLRIDPWLLARADQARAVLRWVWVLVPIGFALVLLVRPVGYVLLPMWVMLAVAGLGYASSLRRRTAREPSSAGATSAMLIGALLTATLFWQTERLAQLGGEALAADLKANVAERLPAVSVLSAGKLHVDASGVLETPLQGPNSAYRYRYEGLYLLQRSGNKYFLLTDGWQFDRGRLLILTDSESIRLEFGG